MIQQTAPVITTALLYSLYAGTLSYLALKIVLATTVSIRSIYKYHLANLAILIPLIAFLLPLRDINLSQQTAPVQPINTAATNTPHTNKMGDDAIQQVVIQQTEHTSIISIVDQYIMAHSNLIMLLYMAGLFLFSFRLLLQYRQSKNLKTNGTLPVDKRWSDILSTAKNKLGINRPVLVAFTKKRLSPCIIGHAKAIILIPVTLANKLTTEQAEAILLHELAHYKQYDHYINLATQCIKCIQFFNPFVWMLVKLADTYRELSCDETAKHHDRNIELAETLALIAGMQSQHNSLALGLKKGSPLLNRIQALVQIQHDKAPNKILPFALLSILLAVGVVMFSYSKLYSQKHDQLREQLKNISEQMYREGNPKYIVVDAVLDSLVSIPVNTDITYLGDKELWIGGKRFQQPLLDKYEKRLQNFLVKHGEDKETVFTYNKLKTPVTLEDILNPSSPFRKLTPNDLYRAGITTRAWRHTFNEMYKDGLINQLNDSFSMDYGPQGISINKGMITGAILEKYQKMLSEEVGIGKSVGGSLTFYDLQKYLTKTGEPTGGTARPTKEKQEQINRNSSTSILLDTNKTFQPTHQDKKLSEKEILNILSDSMFSSGNHSYAIIDAIKDGYIKNGQEYEVKFNHTTFSIPGQIMPVDAQRKYNNKLKYFYKTHSYCENETITISSKLNGTVSDPDFRKQFNPLRHPEAENNDSPTLYSETTKPHKVIIDLGQSSYVRSEASNTRDIQKIANSMHTDNLLDTSSYYKIEYRPDGLYVNSVRIHGSLSNRYVCLLNNIGYQPEDSLDYEHIPHGLKVPTWKYDNTTVQITTHGNNLKAITQKMFSDGNEYFILAQALRDGVIKEHKHYNFMYNRGVVTIDGKKLAEPMQSTYVNMIERFKNAHDRKSLYNFSFRGGGITAQKLNEIQAEFQQKNTTKATNRSSIDPDHKIISLLATDRLIDTNTHYKVKYNRRGIFVNGNKLNDQQAAIYEPYLIKAHGHKPSGGDDVIIIENNP